MRSFGSYFSLRLTVSIFTLLLLLPLLAHPVEAQLENRDTGTGGTASASVASRAVDGDLAAALSSLEWRNIGPAIMGGRVSDFAVVESNPAVFFVGTATGGVWKTVNGGTSFEPLFDDQPTSSIGDVTISQSNPNLIWVGSGEPQNRQSSPYGNGVYKSIDGGRSWSHMGLYESRHISRIRIDPTDNNTVFVAAVGQLWGANEERGVFRSKDGGASWEKVLYVDENTGAIDLAMDPNDPETLFAAMYQRRRTSWGFNGGGPGSGIYRTRDGGASWQELTEGLPRGQKGRIGLDIYRRDGNLVYALVEAGRNDRGVYRSTDRGDTWEHLNTTNSRPMYYSQIRIDPNNPERIYLGGSSLYRTDDGGRNFTNDAARGVHSDHHALWIDPQDSSHLLLGGDGGVSVSWDRSNSWRQLTNMTLAQFYEIGVDMRDPYTVCGGLQDNGSWCGPSATWSRQGILNRDWYNVGGGDGFYVRIDPDDPDILFSESQGGNMQRLDLDTGERQRIRPLARPQGGAPEKDLDARWNWDSPVIISSHDSSILYAGSNQLMKSNDRGVTWEAISPDLTKQIDRDKLEIMGALPTNQMLSRNDGISSYGNLTTISESPVNPTVIYAGTDDGNLQGTRDGGASWELLNRDMPGVPERTYVSRVVASRFKEGTVYATFDGHDRNDYRPYVYVSDDFGKGWQAIVNGLPDDWSVNVIYEHPNNPDLLFVGNEVGVYFSLDRGASWMRLKNNLPTVPVDDIVVHPRENDLVIGTHGRGIWILDDITPLERMSALVLESPAHLFPVRPATAFNVNSPQGWTPGAYAAPNPPYGARIRYYLKENAPLPTRRSGPRRPAPPQGPPGFGGGGFGGFFGQGRPVTERPPEPPKPTVKLTILDADGQVVREMKGPGAAGVQEAVWDLRINPAFEPEPGQQGFGRGFRRFGGGQGPRVLPGTYTVRLEAAEQTLTTEVVVKGDPRIQISRADLEARQRALMDAYALSKPFYEAGRAVQRIGQQIGEIRELLTDNDSGNLSDEIQEISKEVRELGQQMNQARRGLGASFAIQGYTSLPTEDQLWQIDQAWQQVPGLIDRVNQLISERMPALIGQVYQSGFGPDPGEPIAMPQRPAR
ncbi:MAG: hypothetical protein ACE5HV_04840 [Acidobacteriota bacterium]